jgi:CRP-like cAMP-binding protein
MRYLDEALTRLTLKSTAEADTSHLFKVAEYYAKQNQFNQAYYAYHQYIKFCSDGGDVPAARERMKKIAPYVKATKMEYGADEFNRVDPKDSMLFAENEPGEEMYIIQKGSVKISKIVDNNEVLLAVLKAGDIFGEMSLLESKPRAASATAYEGCQVLAVNRANFERMIATQPQIITRLTTLLSERIWFIYKQLANTLISDPLGRMYDALLIQLEKKQINLSSAQSFTFDFGPKELVNMVGLPQSEGSLVLKKMLENKKIQILHDKICTIEICEISKQTEYFRKMQKIEKARRENANWV